MAKRRVDVARAKRMRAARLTWREIGVLLAAEMGRRVPFSPESVRKAVFKETRNNG